jgi:3D (Asp-Asp-Asp) domain-containing protein
MTRIFALAAAAALVAVPLVQVGSVAVAGASGGNTTYTAGVPSLDTITNGPWTLSQGDSTVGAPYSESLPTYTPGGTPTQAGGYPNLAVYPATGAPPGPPYATGMAGTPGPVDAYCTGGGAAPETGTQAAEPANTALPMSPYYFPFIEQTPGDPTQGHLTGFFDYRPKDTEEATLEATSTNGGLSWTYVSKVLEQNPESYCPMGDTNDNGEGHAFVMTVAGTTYLYTLQRAAGDYPGVGMIVHALHPSGTNLLAGLNSSEALGTDPDTFAAGSASVANTGGTSISVTALGSGPETVGAGQFEDLDAASPTGSLITCTGAGGTTLTGCTTANASGLTVNSGDPLVQPLGDVTTAVTIPQGPNTVAETGGVTVLLNANLSTIAAANVPGRFYIDGNPVYCVNNNNPNELDNCTTTAIGGLSVTVGTPVTTDPILAADTGTAGGAVGQTNGLVAPDGIVGVVPSPIAYPGAPGGSTVIIYGEKILNYYIEGTVATAVTLPAASITMTPSTTPTEPLSSGANTIYLGSTTGSPGSIQTVTCTGYSAGTFSGCSGGTGSVKAGNDVGGPGAAIASPAVLAAIGEGSTKPKTLFKNNEDLTLLRAAYTTDGINFTDLGPISGTDPSHLTDVSNPVGQTYPASINLAPGTADNPELRYVGTRGTIILNPDGSIGMFDSGAWESDGDSDAFDQIFYTSSTDGVHWTTPVVIESTDYTFSARQQQDAALAQSPPVDQPLGISAYFAGRAYGPTIVQNPDGTLTMVFAGYSTPKPIPLVGAALGDQQGGAPQWTVQPNDPALYRNILTVTLTPSAGANVPEAPVTILLPIGGLLVLGAIMFIRRRKVTARA